MTDTQRVSRRADIQKQNLLLLLLHFEEFLHRHQVSQKTNGTLLDADVGMMIEQTAAYNAFKIYPSGGNFDAGTLKIYGAL